MGQTNVPAENFLNILREDVRVLMDKQPKYGDSWRKRDHSAGDNLSRKWDRIELALEMSHFDIFQALRDNPGDTGLIDDLRDLRNYLTLIEEHAIALGILAPRGSALAMLEGVMHRGSMSVTTVKRDPAPEPEASVGAEDESNRMCDCGHVARAHASGLGACLMEPNGDLCPCDAFHRTVSLTAKGPLTLATMAEVE